jgi:hypothetical protein
VAHGPSASCRDSKPSHERRLDEGIDAGDGPARYLEHEDAVRCEAAIGVAALDDDRRPPVRACRREQHSRQISTRGGLPEERRYTDGPEHRWLRRHPRHRILTQQRYEAIHVIALERVDADVLPGLVVMALGLGAVFVGVQNAANAGVPPEQAGLAAALITASSTLGGALGLAIFSAIATSRTHNLLATHVGRPEALTSGFGYALTACSLFLVAAAAIALRTASTRGQKAPNPDRVMAADAA